MSSLLDILEDEETGPPDGLVTPDELWRLYDETCPEMVAIDTESPHFRWHIKKNCPFAATFYWEGAAQPYYLEIQPEDTEEERANEAVAEVMRRIMLATPRILYHNAKYDLHVTKRIFDRFGIPLIAREVDDTMILSFVTNENRFHGLKELCDGFGIMGIGGQDPTELKQRVADWIAEQKELTGVEPGWHEVPKRIMVPYAVQDAYLTFELEKALRAEMDEQMEQTPRKDGKDIADIYALEMRLMWVIFGAEERGMRVDKQFVAEQISALTPQVAELKTRADELIGWPLNPGSTDDIAKVLQDLQVDTSVWINPKTGREKLPEWVLEGLIKTTEDPKVKEICEITLEYRGATKLLSTYFETILEDAQQDENGDWIIRCNIKQTGARTGRTSVTDPPLQTLPRKKGNVREAFIARSGHKLVFADYSQQELRVLAHYMEKGANDRSMSRIFADPDADLHTETAVSIYQVPADRLEPHMRPNAKDTNFAIVYGAGVPKMKAILGAKTDEEGDIFLKRYHGRFPGIRILKRKTKQLMESRKFILTVFGRRHRDPTGRLTYKAINSLVQGTSADLSKAAMIRIDDELRTAGMRGIILLMVHDEIITEVPDEEVDAVVQIIERSMTDFADYFCVPLKVDIKVDDRWHSKEG